MLTPKDKVRARYTPPAPIKINERLFDPSLLTAVVYALAQEYKGKNRKENAILRAFDKLQRTNWQYKKKKLTVTSDSGKTYTASPRKCECAAYNSTKDPGPAIPCWHRLGAIMLKRYRGAYKVIAPKESVSK